MSDDWPFDSESMKQVREAFARARKANQEDADNFWNNLSYDDKCNAFHAVVERIHKGDIVDRGSYRWVLYDVFHFGPDMYARGMDCGYMAIHNSIVDGEDAQEKSRKWFVKDNAE